MHPLTRSPPSTSHTRVLTADRYQLASYNLSPDTSDNILFEKINLPVGISVKTQKLVGTSVLPVVTASQLYRDMFVGW